MIHGSRITRKGSAIGVPGGVLDGRGSKESRNEASAFRCLTVSAMTAYIITGWVAWDGLVSYQILLPGAQLRTWSKGRMSSQAAAMSTMTAREEVGVAANNK